MKILFITTGNVNKVATMKRATGMSESLIDLGHDVFIVAMKCEENIKRFELECPRTNILWFSQTSALQELYQKYKIVSPLKPDVVYVCGMVFRNMIVSPILDNSITVVIEHSELLSAIPNISSYKRIISKTLEKYSFKLFDGQIVASRCLESIYKDFDAKETTPILYSPYAFNINLVNKRTLESENFVARFRGKKIVLYMGTLRLNYGFGDIIKSSSMLRKKIPNLLVLIIGGGVHSNIGKQLISNLNLERTVEMLGFVSEESLNDYFSIADAFVAPIYNTLQDEARCPSKLFMYLPFNKPIITSEIGVCKELFGKNYPFYCISGSIDSMAEAMFKALITDVFILPFNVDDHEWKKRSIDFLIWINDHFKKK